MAEKFVESNFAGLLVKISSAMGGNAGGKVYLIPQNSLQQFELLPSNPAFNQDLDKKYINVDYAVFRQDMIIRGNAG